MIRNKKGSSMVLLAMVFVTMMISITAAIGIARALVIKSECETFGHVWNKAILSEYDVNLLDEYNLMAYWGNEAEVQKKIDLYLDYSAGSKLDASIGHSSAELAGYELGDVENFRKAVKNSMAFSAIDTVMHKKGRHKRDDEEESDYGSRTIVNPVVLDTLPSNGKGSSIDVNDFSGFKDLDSRLDKLLESATDLGGEMAFINMYLGNKVTGTSHKDGFFKNEWEYIIRGKPDDEANYEFCRNCIFAIRNAVNIVFLLKDPEKRSVITSVAECLTPGPAGVLTTAVIAEIWAAAESMKDVDTLLNNGRVPFVKTADSWQTDVDSLLDSEDFTGKLDQESKDALHDEEGNIKDMHGAAGRDDSPTKGQNYDEYLMAIMMMIGKDVRTRRLMDIVQINMKYWHYRDFNMMEYYTGVRYSINANGRSYDFEDCYQ